MTEKIKEAKKQTLGIRPEVDEYFLKIAKVVSQRSTCLRHSIGAVLVKDKQIISTGYNGAPAGVPDCLELGCLRDQRKIVSGTMHEVCRAVHAEQNAIVQAAKHGISTAGSTIYMTHTPCLICAKMIVNAGIKRVVSIKSYPDDMSYDLLKEAGVEFEVHFEPELEIGDVGERVLVVERSLFEKLGAFEGLKLENFQELYDGLLSGVKFVFRDEAESDIRKKQLIPQFLVRSGDEYFISKRLAKTDEPRLRDIYYIAFGGHVNPIDSSEKTGDVIDKAANRELEEEIQCEIKSKKLIGLVNDEEMEVSRYHLGIIYLVEVESKSCKIKEHDQLEGTWVHKDELGKYFEEGDSWSRYIWKDLIQAGKI